MRRGVYIQQHQLSAALTGLSPELVMFVAADPAVAAEQLASAL